MNMNKKILDDVHGMILLTDNEFELIQLPIFQRLRNLKQLGIAHQVFPGTVHNRFSHSLGVLHILSRMINQFQHFFSSEEISILRYSALLHDIGHYPLSHIGELAYQNRLSYSNIEENDMKQFFIKNNQDIKDIIENQLKGKYSNYDDTMVFYHHENISAEIVLNNPDIRSILIKDFPEHIDNSLQKIAQIITGKSYIIKGDHGSLEYDSKLCLMTQFMHSELDADRLDYLLRDSKESGTTFGILNIDYLISNLKIAEIKNDNYKTGDQYPIFLCLKYSAAEAADQFLINRFYSYLNVVFNDKVLLLNKVAEILIGYFLKNNKFINADILSKYVRGELKNSERDYRLFDDYLYWKILNDLDNQKTCPDVMSKLITKILNNKELNCDDTKEIRIIDNNINKFKEYLDSTNVLEKDDVFNIYFYFDITKTLDEKQFNEKYINAKLKDRIKAELKQLFEGIKILQPNGQVKLLVNCDRSLMRNTHKQKLLCLRSYQI